MNQYDTAEYMHRMIICSGAHPASADINAIGLMKIIEELSGCRPEPLTDEEIYELIINKVTDYDLCRAIEERHGIK